MIIQRFNLNLIPNQSPMIVHVNQYDTGTGRLIATLYEGNEPYSPNGTAVIQGTKPDGHGFQYTATLDGNVVTADLTEQMAPVAGDVRTQIVVTESSGVTGTFAFIIRVQPSALPSDTDMSESDYPLIEEAIREAQEAVQTAQEATERAQEAIAETQENAENSEAWAQGTRGGIPVEPTDPTYEHNAEYWAQYAERYAQGGLHYKASIPFADIPTTGMREGDMYDITDDFTTDSRFTEGAGIKVKGGTNIAWNSDNKWDILALPYIPKTTFNGRSGSILPMAGDYDSKKILLTSALHIGGETQSDVQEALEALSNDGVKSFNGRSGSVLPMAGDYSAEQVNYDSNQTVKQKIDALVTKEASDIAGQQSLVKDTVGWTGKNLLKNEGTSGTTAGITYTKNNDGSVTANGTATARAYFNVGTIVDAGTYILSGCPTTVSRTFDIYVALRKTGETTIYYSDIGQGVTFTLPEGWTANISISVWEGQTVNNLTFRPMLRKADITDPTYEPYHESVEVMYEEEIHGVNLATAYPNYVLIGDSTQGFHIEPNRTGGLIYIAPIRQNTSYIASKAQVGNRFRIVLFKNEPSSVSSTDAYQVIREDDTSRTSYEFTNTDYNYVVFATAGEGGGGDVNTTNGMIRKADIEDSTYRPYNEQAIQNQLNAQGVLGAKNLLQNTATSQTINGVTFTVNADKSITVSPGTATNNAVLELVRPIALKQGKYILSGCPTHNYGNNVYIQLRKSDNPQVDIRDTGNSQTINVTSDTTYSYVAVVILSGVVLTSALTFYPMLRLASDPDDTYQPYAMTNRELTEEKINIVDLKAVVSASSDFADFKTRIASL